MKLTTAADLYYVVKLTTAADLYKAKLTTAADLYKAKLTTAADLYKAKLTTAADPYIDVTDQKSGRGRGGFRPNTQSHVPPSISP